MNINFEKYMSDFVNVNEVELYRIIKYQLGWEDEYGNPIDQNKNFYRTYSSSVLDISEIFGTTSNINFPFAASVEILANSWMVHGDVQSGVTDRNGKSSVWWVWGPAQSINTGDGLHALARLCLLENKFNINSEILLRSLKIFDSAYLTLCEGENLDISYQESPLVSEKDYMNMVKKRSGSLFSCAFEFGYISSVINKKMQIDNNILSKINELGEKIGILNALSLDVSLINNSNKVGPELFHRFSSKKKNIFVVYVLNNSDPSIKRKIGEIYLKRVLEENDLNEIIPIIKSSNFFEYYSELKSEIENSCVKILDNLEFNQEQKDKFLIIMDKNEIL